MAKISRLSEDRLQCEIPEFLSLFTDFFILSDFKLSLIVKSAHKKIPAFFIVLCDRRKYLPLPPRLESILQKVRSSNLRSIK